MFITQVLGNTDALTWNQTSKRQNQIRNINCKNAKKGEKSKNKQEQLAKLATAAHFDVINTFKVIVFSVSCNYKLLNTIVFKQYIGFNESFFTFKKY